MFEESKENSVENLEEIQKAARRHTLPNANGLWLSEPLLSKKESDRSSDSVNYGLGALFDEQNINVESSQSIQVRMKKKQVAIYLMKLGFEEAMISLALDSLTNIEKDTNLNIIDRAIDEIQTLQLNQSYNDGLPLQTDLLTTPRRYSRPLSIRRISSHSPIMPPSLSMKKPQSIEDQKDLHSIEPLTRTCSICLENFAPSKRTREPSCNRIHFFCEDCLFDFLAEKINSSNVLKICCPQEGCTVEYTENQIKTILNNEEEFQKYLRFKQVQKLNLDPDTRWCTRAGCNNAMKGNPGKQKLECNVCGQEICYYCTNNWHEGQSCENAIDQEYKEVAKVFSIKFCPQCRSRIQKSEGCNHMTCPRCSHQFCWLCLKTYTYKHYSQNNLRGCPGLQFSDGVPRFHYAKIISKLVLKGFGIFLLGILGLSLFPAALVLGAILLPMFMYFIVVDESKSIECGCGEILKFIFLFFLGCITFPLNIPIALVAGVLHLLGVV